MVENIVATTELIKTKGNLASTLSDSDFANKLEALAQDIEHLECQAIFCIAARFGQAHELY